MAHDFAKVRVILVEDNVSDRALFSFILRSLKIQFQIDSTGEQVVDLAKATPPDIIFLDLTLPNRSGYEVFGELRQIETLKAVRIIAITATDPGIALPRCKELGFDGYIAKPIRQIAFVKQVERILDGQEVWDDDPTQYNK